MKTKYLILAIISFVIIFSCKKDEPTPEPFNFAAQSLRDDVKIKDYLETHFYTPPAAGEHFGVIAVIANGETPIMDNVIEKDVTYANIGFKMYILKDNPEGVNISPIRVDSVLVNYKGMLFDTDKTVFDSNSSNGFWANLYGGVIPGWSYGMPYFKSGNNISVEGQPLAFSGTGKGVIFIPSGLGYANTPTVAIPANSPLIFHVEAASVKRTDIDRDGVLSFYEDTDGDGEVNNDDFDADTKPNFIDFDDDNDGIATKYENADVNGDGNPDDSIDTDGDNNPDYLDSDDDGDGIATKSENSDPNGDGNPDDAKDSDGDNVPDYLDAN